MFQKLVLPEHLNIKMIICQKISSRKNVPAETTIGIFLRHSSMKIRVYVVYTLTSSSRVFLVPRRRLDGMMHFHGRHCRAGSVDQYMLVGGFMEELRELVDGLVHNHPHADDEVQQHDVHHAESADGLIPRYRKLCKHEKITKTELDKWNMNKIKTVKTIGEKLLKKKLYLLFNCKKHPQSTIQSINQSIEQGIYW